MATNKQQRDRLVKQIREILTQEIDLSRMARGFERMMNTEIPGTPRISGRRRSARVLYVALPGRGKAKTNLTKRTSEVWKFVRKQGKTSALALQESLEVNRNVIAGAIHELKQAGLIKVEQVK